MQYMYYYIYSYINIRLWHEQHSRRGATVGGIGTNVLFPSQTRTRTTCRRPGYPVVVADHAQRQGRHTRRRIAEQLMPSLRFPMISVFFVAVVEPASTSRRCCQAPSQDWAATQTAYRFFVSVRGDLAESLSRIGG